MPLHRYYVVTMAENSSQIASGDDKLWPTADSNANTALTVTKMPLSKKASLLPAVKQQLETALSDMKKSVVNLKKSPWMLTRSSLYLSSFVFSTCTISLLFRAAVLFTPFS